MFAYFSVPALENKNSFAEQIKEEKRDGLERYKVEDTEVILRNNTLSAAEIAVASTPEIRSILRLV